MHSDYARRLFTAALVATVVFVVPAQAAGRRRAVTPPTAGGLLTADEVTGTVTDDVTNQPVAAVKVTVGNRTDTTDAAGKFKVKNVSSYHGLIVVEAARSGYATKKLELKTSGNQVLAISLHPGATVHVRKPSGTQFDLDFDSSEFGYPVVFSGYNSATNEQFCKPNGAAVTIDRSEIKRINGPATMVHVASCCAAHDVLKVNAELKTGEITDLYFVDTCSGIPSIEFIGRDHVTGKIVFTPFTDIAEVVFP
jgi:hypothetical protein